MRIETVVKHDSVNSCFVCGEQLLGKYFEINFLDGQVALLVCSNDCEADVWSAMALLYEE